MAKPKRRKLELYRLTISGLNDDVDYQSFLMKLWKNLHDREEKIFESGDKSHALDQLQRKKGNLWMQFFSYAEGERPDVIDTEDLSIHDNPLGESETFLHWTHGLGKQLKDRYVLLLERVQTGIWPSKVEQYFQWLLDHPENESDALKATADPDEPISVSLELEADKSFMKLVNSMDRIVSATVRIVRPNPGWQDYDKLLGEEARDSDAKFAEVTMKARRGASLAKRDGIVQAMRDLDSHNKLGKAVVEGDIDEERKTVSTESHGKSQYKYLATNENGNVAHDAALDKLFETLGKMTDDV